MTETPTGSESSAGATPGSTGPGASSGSALSRRAPSTGSLQTEKGATTIADAVVTKVASIATREVGGVYELGGGAARALGPAAPRGGRGGGERGGRRSDDGRRVRGLDPQPLRADRGERAPPHRGDHGVGGDR